MQLKTTVVKFPDIKLRTRDGHKLRGFFGDFFRQYSPLLHNHWIDGTNIYKYPKVQYKVIDRIAMLVGVEEGAELLAKLFLKVNFLDIDDQRYYIDAKNLTWQIVDLSDASKLYEYRFKTLWMCLNQKNYKIYRNIISSKEKSEFLNKILIGNILSFYKGIQYWTDVKIMVTGKFQEHRTMFKNQEMLAFSGRFTTNAVLPDFIGIGKSVARGFGTVVKIK